MANYLAATFANQKDAQSAYQVLRQQKIAKKKMTLLGQEKNLPANSPVYDPNQAVRNQVRRMLMWLVPFGFFGGFTFNQITGLTILESASPLVNGLLGGFLGAPSGLLGAVFIGGGLKLFSRDPEDQPFSKRVAAGQYVLVLIGSELELRQAGRLLRSCPHELMQVYEGPGPNDR
ncbi:MAG: hypothetical protein AAGB01_09930 [Cyanobacteria bacterium P01_F01_bin.42]